MDGHRTVSDGGLGQICAVDLHWFDPFTCEILGNWRQFIPFKGQPARKPTIRSAGSIATLLAVGPLVLRHVGWNWKICCAQPCRIPAGRAGEAKRGQLKGVS